MKSLKNIAATSGSGTIVVVLAVVCLLFAGCPTWTNPGTGNDPGSGDNHVVHDFENELWLQYGFKELKVGETAEIFPRRVHEAVTHVINNDVAWPHFNYEVIEGSNVIEISEEDKNWNAPNITGWSANINVAKVKALSTGTAIVKVTYDGFTHPAGKKFDKIGEANAGYVAFSVTGSGSDGTDIQWLNDPFFDNNNAYFKPEWRYRYNTVYFTEGDSYNWNVKIPGASEVTCNGKTVNATNGSDYALPLENRQNIIKITAGGKVHYEMINARKIEITIDPEKPVVGKPFKVSLKGITQPVHKLASIYNPGLGDGTRVKYNLDGAEILSQASQWDISTKNTITATVNVAGTHNFTEGAIREWWFGDGLGSASTKTFPGEQNTSGTTNGPFDFSFLPDFEVTVEDPAIVIPPGGIRSLEELDTYLQKSGSTGKPIPVDFRMDFGGINTAGENWGKLLDILAKYGYEVELDLHYSAGSGMYNFPNSDNSGAGKIVSLVLPDVTEKLAAGEDGNVKQISFAMLKEIHGNGVVQLGGEKPDITGSGNRTPALNAPKLETAVFPALKIIDHNAFSNTALKSFTVANSVTSIGYAAFADISTLTELKFEGGGENFTHLGSRVFGRNTVSPGTGVGTSIKTVTIPSRWIGSRTGFEGLTSLESVTIRGGANLAMNEFANTPKLAQVILESPVGTINDSSFPPELMAVINGTGNPAQAGTYKKDGGGTWTKQ